MPLLNSGPSGKKIRELRKFWNGSDRSQGGRQGEGITENKSNSVRPTPRVGIRTPSSRLGTGLERATSRRTELRARQPSEPRAAALRPGSSRLVVRPPRPRGRADSRGAGPGRCRPADTHLPSRPAPRPLRGSSPGAALPVGRRPRSAGPSCGWPRAPHRPLRTWRRRRLLLLLLQPASPSLPAGGRRARGPARPFSARRRRRGSRGPGSGRGAGGESGSEPRARAPGVGLGPCVRVSESVSHGLGLSIAYEVSKRRGRGSSTAGSHTGNGHGPRALGAGLRGAGRGPGHRPRRAVTWRASRSVGPGVCES